MEETEACAGTQNNNEEITLEYVQIYLNKNEFELFPTQGKISLPLIKRYVKMLRDGKEPPAIHVDDNAIVNGHHRYISGHIYDRKPPVSPWTRSPSVSIGIWHKVLVVNEDFEPGYDETDFNN